MGIHIIVHLELQNLKGIIIKGKIFKSILTIHLSFFYLLNQCVILYQENGITKIGMPKPTMLVSALIGEKLLQFAEDIERRLISCIDDCK